MLTYLHIVLLVHYSRYLLSYTCKSKILKHTDLLFSYFHFQTKTPPNKKKEKRKTCNREIIYRTASPIVLNMNDKDVNDSCILSFEVNKEVSAGFTDGDQPTVDAHGVQLLTGHAVDFQGPQDGGQVPDVGEGHERKLAPPVSRYTHSAEQGHQLVQTASPKPEAEIGACPDEGNAVNSFRFR